MSTSTPSPAPFGAYQLLEQIGAGGMAEVFRARRSGEQGFAKTVVIKRLHPRFAASPAFVQMFAEEAKLAAQVQHKNVVQVYELERVAGELYMAMEWVDGLDLKRLLRESTRRQRRIPPWLSVHAVSEVLEALAFAHDLVDDAGRRRNIVHCDVTPENVFLSRQGDIKLGDFGVAADDTRTTDPFPGQIKGKLPYMSPEQVAGQRPDGRTDVFAAGVVLWECLAQRRLFAAATPAETISRICAAPRVPPSHFAADVPPALDALVLEALQIPHEARIPSAQAMQARLLEVLSALRPRVSLVDVRDALRPFLEVSPAPPAEATADIAIDIDTDLSELMSEAERSELDVPDEVRAGSLLDGHSEVLDPPQIQAAAAPVDPARVDAVVRASAAEATRDLPPGTPPSLEAEVRAIAEGGWTGPPPPRFPAPRAVTGDLPEGPERRTGDLPRPAGDATRDPFTYAIVRPRHAVETVVVSARPAPAVASDASDPERTTPARPPAPRRASSARGPAGSERLRVRANERLLAEDLGLADAVNLLRSRLLTAPDSAPEVSSDGARWLGADAFARLLGEEPLVATPMLPQGEFSGSLKSYSLVALFGTLARTRQTGRLVLVRSGQHGVERREVHLDRGRLANVRSSHGYLDGWGLLLRAEQAPRADVTAALLEVIDTGLPLSTERWPSVAALLGPMRARLMQATLQDLFGWPNGHFGFDVHAPVVRAPGEPLDLLRIVPSMVARARPPEVLRAALDRSMRAALERSERFEEDLHRLNLRGSAGTFARRLGAGATLAEALATAGDETEQRTALVLAYVLLELGLIRAGGAPQR